MEHFYTVQGEGFHQGKAAYFIRLGGCDVGCTWCDVKESWNADIHPKYSVKAIADHAQKSGAEIAVITGGEPLMHDCEALTDQLTMAEIKTHIETSGAHPLSGNWHWICFSPKRFKKPLDEFYQQADELKVVIAHQNDLRWAERHAEKMHTKALLYLQPEWDERSSMTPLIVDYVKANPQWRISVQAHKFIDVP